ncbi:hypothetical protein AKJ56_01940 [candidate division MSBL1 archaeon SCGC-AAA382N08]|uniref:Protein-L-isoaspartate O-methyltransferase n=1 Tax=candidate division MSBL1 archaeon SCGC-AAA382N08 TaxID=1698285 RepID=A0A133VNQ0_9EURY|nr:hypothetical protein AKJ56_01940 [candidate division MSBL1 archaeon SCGC-AAA382N08]
MYEQKREDMVNSLKKRGYLKNSKIIEAFQKVRREEFVPPRVKEDAYADRPLSIGNDQTISAPSMIAIMLEVLEAEKGQKILEIGTGSGYNAALLAEIVGDEGRVYSLERLESVAETGKKNLKKNGYKQVKVIVKDGTKGYEEESPWDRIIITACAPEVPKTLKKQLKVGGILVGPVGEHYRSQTLLEMEKEGKEKIKTRKHGTCAFVPLIGEFGWNKSQT